VGGRGWKTTVVQTYGGNEYRNQAWSQERGMWTFDERCAARIPRSAVLLHRAAQLLPRVRGRFNGFRFQGFLDHADEAGGVLGTTGLAVAATVAYQMYKNYSGEPAHVSAQDREARSARRRSITTACCSYSAVNYNIDESTGIVTFTVQPTSATRSRGPASFEVPCRFDFDSPQLGPSRAARCSTGRACAWSSCGTGNHDPSAPRCLRTSRSRIRRSRSAGRWTLKNGTVLYFTDHDADLVISGWRRHDMLDGTYVGYWIRAATSQLGRSIGRRHASRRHAQFAVDHRG
jgi:uncharacterized protein (TIGR02217 family)